MTVAIIGATGGRIGGAVAQRLLRTGERVRGLVRNPGKARQLLGEVPHTEILPVRLDDSEAVARALAGVGTAFLAMGSVGMEANIQRTVIQAAGRSPDFSSWFAWLSLNAGPDGVGINQRGHWSVDFAAQAAGLPQHHHPPFHLHFLHSWWRGGDQGRTHLDRPRRHRPRGSHPPRRHRRCRGRHPGRLVDLGTAPRPHRAPAR